MLPSLRRTHALEAVSLLKCRGGYGVQISLPKTQKKRQQLSSTEPFPTSCGFIVLFRVMLTFWLISVLSSAHLNQGCLILLSLHFLWCGGEQSFPVGMWDVPSWRGLRRGRCLPGAAGRRRDPAGTWRRRRSARGAGTGPGRRGGSLARRDFYFEARQRL